MFAVIITAAAAAAVILSAAGCAGRLKKIRIGTAGIGGNYNSFGNAYAQLLMGDYKGVDVEVKVTAGSGENLKLITKEPPEIDLAIMQADVISEMQKTDGNTSGFKAVAGMYTEAVQIVVRKDSGITDVSDLHGKKIGIGASGSGTEKNAMLILKVIGERMLDKTGIYHFSDEGAISWYDFSKAICQIGGNTCDISPCHTEDYPSKAERPHFSVLDKTKVKATFGIRIPYWRDSLEDCVKRIKGR